MKVLQINAVSSIGSTGRICVEMADYLNSNDHDGYIAYSAGMPYEKGYKIGTWLEIKLHGLYSRIFGMQAYFSHSATKKLVQFITDLKPDIVHLHNLHGNYINLKLILNYLSKNDIPTVITLHDCWFFTGKCTHYTADRCYKWQTGCGNCPRIKKDNPSWLFDRTQKMYNDKKAWFGQIPSLAVVGVSDWITNEARNSFLSSAITVSRIYNWIDLNVFKPMDTTTLHAKLSFKNKFIILGVASEWSNAKGLDQFIELADIISPEMQIVLIGGLKKENDLPKNIIHIGVTHNAIELAKYYSLANVYIHLSLEETFGKTIAEAMSCGTPAIVYNSTACPELIGKDCGYVIEKRNISAVYMAIQRIKADGKPKYSAICRKHVQQNFDYQENAEKTIQIYKSLLNR